MSLHRVYGVLFSTTQLTNIPEAYFLFREPDQHVHLSAKDLLSTTGTGLYSIPAPLSSCGQTPFNLEFV